MIEHLAFYRLAYKGIFTRVNGFIIVSVITASSEVTAANLIPRCLYLLTELAIFF